ncbi:IS3 family transposase [Streptomyces scopuliridis]|uniref:IS3 family transposase n=1 Tax=Streptomyces scopuliridis TaxID=452529 RepID=UPI0036B55549
MRDADGRPAGSGGGTEARAARQGEEDALLKEIREIHAEHRDSYGTLRVHAELCGVGHTVNRKRVARLMRKHGLTGSRRPPGPGPAGLHRRCIAGVPGIGPLLDDARHGTII